ncbi:MAG: aminoacyl-tRNA hydrolase [Candidatus Scalinduaceae bacterium]
MKIVIGLGNPGRKYAKTRHNVGFMVVDKFIKEHKVSLAKKRYDSIISECYIEGEKTLFVKPQTFMNASGIPVKKIVEIYDNNLDDMLTILDDINLPLGKIKIRKKGSSGGHKGLQSVSDHLQTTCFPRLRIGIGNCFTGDISDTVLSRFTKEEINTIEGALDKACKAVNIWITKGTNNCMNMFN